jgi:hypothetical protein
VDAFVINQPGSLTGAESYPFEQATVSKRQFYCLDGRDEDGGMYLAVFNTGLEEASIETSFSKLGLTGTYILRDVWKRENIGQEARSIVLLVPAHGARLLKLERK